MRSQAEGWQEQIAPLEQVPVLTLAPVDSKRLLAEDEAVKGRVPLRFAIPNKVYISPGDAGKWESLKNGGQLWRFRVYSPGATDLNFGFSRYRLPKGATLHIYSESEDYYEGPYTSEDNEAHGQLWTPVLPGNRADIELYLPAGSETDFELELIQVGSGYRNLFILNQKFLPKSGACNIDVICPEGDPWRDQIRSVARYTRSGAYLCTGSLIMDVPESFTPFFLTANHCGINAGNAATVVAYWNFESPVCGMLGGGSLTDNQTGAIFRASETDVDVALIELDDSPDPAFNVFYSGWDATGTTPAGSVGIHHPNSDEKAISFNDDLLTTGNSCIGSGGFNSHWYVDNWEEGTTEPGSSGSGLWDSDSKLIVGFLSGGIAACDGPVPNNGYDCYGKFSLAWAGGSTPSTRLKDWLDPGDTGILMVDVSDPLPQIFYESHQGDDNCASNMSNENGVWEPGESIDIAVEIKATGNFSNIQGTLTSSTTGVGIIDGSTTWPDMTSGSTAMSNTPFQVQFDSSIACLSQVDFQVQVTATEGGPFNLSFSNSIGASPEPDVPVAIPDEDPNGATSTLEIIQDVTLTDVNVYVNIQHTWVGDIFIKLISPVGTEVVLLDRPGYSGSGFGCSNNNMDITFDDAFGFDLETHCEGTDPWYSGDASPVEALSAFNSKSSAGTWTLFVSDNAIGDTGTIIDWELIPTPVIQGQCTVCEDITNPCEGNFDGDSDVDGFDFATFFEDYGRTDCP